MGEGPLGTFEKDGISHCNWCGQPVNEKTLKLSRRIRTLIEDFDNPCFGGKIHNEIPHQIGLLVIEAEKKEGP